MPLKDEKGHLSFKQTLVFVCGLSSYELSQNINWSENYEYLFEQNSMDRI